MITRKKNAILAPLAALACFTIGAVSGPREDVGSWSKRRWLEWRDEQIAKILKTEPGPAGSNAIARASVVARCAEVNEFLEPLTARHPAFFTKDPAMRNFVGFVKAQAQMSKPAYSLGMEVSDLQYWRTSAPMFAFPPLLKSQEFLRAMASPEGYVLAANLIERQNAGLPPDRKWVVVPFEAQFVKSVDQTTYGRMLVFIPNEPTSDGASADKWVLFAIATPEMKEPVEIKSVSMVAVHRDARGASKTYLMDFFRHLDKASGRVGVIPTAILPENPSKNCYDCHKSGVVPIHPLKEYRFDASGLLVAKEAGEASPLQSLTARIRSYGSQDRVTQDIKSYGPCIAPKGLTRRQEFIREATVGMGLSNASHERIRAAMACGGCHQDFAPINYPQAVQTHGDATAFRRKEGIVQTYVENGWMPPNNTLTPEERKGLWKCLVKEYFDAEKQSGVLVDWLRGIERQ